MRSIMIFGTLFCFWMAGLSTYTSLRNISILRHGHIATAVLVQKPKRYVSYRSGYKGTAVYNHEGTAFRVDMREDDAGDYAVGDSIDFLCYSVHPGVFLKMSETINRQYWTFGAGVLFALFGGASAWYWLVGIARIERRQKQQMDAAIRLPNGKPRSKAKYAHLVLKTGKAKKKG